MPINKKKGINPIKAGFAGAAVVAAGAAAVVLSKKENRKKAGKALKDLKIKGEKLTKHAAIRIDKVIKDEKLLRDTTQTAVTAVRKAVKPKTGTKTSGKLAKARSKK